MDLAFTSQKTSLFDGRHAPQMYLFYLQKKTKKKPEGVLCHALSVWYKCRV